MSRNLLRLLGLLGALSIILLLCPQNHDTDKQTTTIVRSTFMIPGTANNKKDSMSTASGNVVKVF